MKKLMILGAALLAAVCTQAASIRWSNGNNSITWKSTGTTSIAAGQAIYLVLNAYQNDIVNAIKAGTFSASTAGVIGSATTSNTRSAVAANVVSSDLLQLGGTSYDFSTLVFDTVSGTKYYQFSSTKPSRAWVAGDTTYGDTGNAIAFAAANYNAANWTAVAPTPEPACMALVLMGVALIGLRRRIAK